MEKQLEGVKVEKATRRWTKKKIALAIVGLALLTGSFEEYVLKTPEQRAMEAVQKEAAIRKAAIEAEYAHRRRMLEEERNCAETRAYTEERWNQMSELLKMTISTECRPPFAGPRTLKSVGEGAVRAELKVLSRIGQAAHNFANKEF